MVPTSEAAFLICPTTENGASLPPRSVKDYANTFEGGLERAKTLADENPDDAFCLYVRGDDRSYLCAVVSWTAPGKVAVVLMS